MTDAGEVALLMLTGAGLLLALTILAEVLRARLSPVTSPGVETFATRVQAWWAMAILLALALIAGRWGVVALFAFASFACLREFATYTAKARDDHAALALAFFVVLPAQFLFVGVDRPDLFTVFVPVHVFGALSVLAALAGSPQRYLARVAETQWALMICVYGGSHVPALMNLDLAGMDGRGVLLIPFLVIAVQGGEVVDTVAGRRWGRTRIAPALSPRTWEGAAAGTLGAGLVGAGLAWLTPFGVAGAAGMGAVAGALGLAGTLVLAAVKRERGVRDWSHLIPGQGGLLDQMGGVLFAAPVAYHLAAWGWG